MDLIAARTRALYDRAAQDYVTVTGDFGLFPGLDDELTRFLRRAARTGPVLDLGSGVGRDAEWLHRRGRPVVAADLSEGMLRVTGDRCPRVALVQAEMTSLPFRDDCFAGVWACASLVHLASAQHPRALGEMFRALRPGGAVAVSMKAGEREGWVTGGRVPEERWFTYVDMAGFAELMRAAGFRDVSTLPSGRGTWFIAEGIKPRRSSSTRPDHSSAGSA